MDRVRGLGNSGVKIALVLLGFVFGAAANAVTVKITGTVIDDGTFDGGLDATDYGLTGSSTVTLYATFEPSTIAELDPGPPVDGIISTLEDPALDFTVVAGSLVFKQNDGNTETDATNFFFTDSVLDGFEFFSVNGDFEAGTDPNILLFAELLIGTDPDVYDVAFEAEWDFSTATVVPIPAAFPLFLSALFGLGWLRRRKGLQAQG